MPEKFTRTDDGKDVFINPEAVISTEQTRNADVFNTLSLGLFGESEATTIKTAAGSIEVEGSAYQVNNKLGK